MYNQDQYYDPYYQEEKKPVNWGVVGSTALGAGAGLAIPAYLESSRKNYKAKLRKGKNLKENYKSAKDSILTKYGSPSLSSNAEENYKTLLKEGKERLRDIDDELAKKDSKKIKDLKDEIKNAIATKNKTKELEKANELQELVYKYDLLERDREDVNKQYYELKNEYQDKKDRKIQDTKDYEKYKKELKEKKKKIYGTNNTNKLDEVYSKKGKKYIIDNDNARTINKKYNTLKTIEKDWENIRGISGKGKLGAIGRLILAPATGAVLGNISGRAIFGD